VVHQVMPNQSRTSGWVCRDTARLLCRPHVAVWAIGGAVWWWEVG